MSAATQAPAGPELAPAAAGEFQAVFRYIPDGREPWAVLQAAAGALADNNLAGPDGYGVIAVAYAGRVVVERQDGKPLPNAKAPAWRKLARVVREAIPPDAPRDPR